MRDLTVRLDEQSEELRREFRAWLRDHLPDPGEPADQDAMYARQLAWHRTLHEGGWVGLDWPVEYGGRGASALQKYAYYEELARVRAPRLLNHPAVALVGPTMMHFAAEPLKARYLPRILSADDVWCQGFSEPDAGSDLAALRTSAVLDGDRWVISGQKIWTTWAMYATRCALLCRTDPAAPRHRGLSMLVVDMDQPGVQVRPIRQMTGRHEFCEVFFTEAATPADHVIGEPGQGWAAAVKMLEFERSDQSFTDHTRLLALLDALAPGVAPAADPPAGDARQQFVSLWSRTQLLRATNLAAARTVAAGGGVSSRGSIVKLSWSELLRDIAGFGDDLASTHPSAAPSAAPGIDAGTGPSSDPGSAELWRELYLETRSATVYSGTSEIQRDIIAQRLAGMPHR